MQDRCPYVGPEKGLYKPSNFSSFMRNLKGATHVSGDMLAFDPHIGVWHLEPQGVTLRYFSAVLPPHRANGDLNTYQATVTLFGKPENIAEVVTLLDKAATQKAPSNIIDELRFYERCAKTVNS